MPKRFQLFKFRRDSFSTRAFPNPKMRRSRAQEKNGSSLISIKFALIFFDFLDDAEKTLRILEISRFQFHLIFTMIIPEIYLIFD